MMGANHLLRSRARGVQVFNIAGLIGTLALLLLLVNLQFVSFETAAIALGIVLGIFLTQHSPSLALAIIMVLYFARGEYETLSLMSYVILGIVSTTSTLYLIAKRAFPLTPWVTVSILFLAWMSIRFASSGDLPSAVAVGAVTLTWPIVAKILTSRSGIQRVFELTGLLFSAGIILTIPSWDPSLRFTGFSGNPNAMVFMAILTLPFLISAWINSRSFARLLYSLSVFISVGAVIVSGSSQGYVALLIIGLGLCYLYGKRIVRAERRRLWIALISVFLLSLGLLVGGLFRSAELRDDLFTLSGRTPIHRAFFEAFFDAPFLGAGSRRASWGETLDRTAHSSVFEVFYAGGALAGLVWLGILVLLVIVGLRVLRSGHLWGASFLLLVLVQSVQTVTFSLPAWILIFFAMAIGGRRLAGRGASPIEVPFGAQFSARSRTAR